MLSKPTRCGRKQPGSIICITGLGYAGPPHFDLTLKQKMVQFVSIHHSRYITEKDSITILNTEGQ